MVWPLKFKGLNEKKKRKRGNKRETGPNHVVLGRFSSDLHPFIGWELIIY